MVQQLKKEIEFCFNCPLGDCQDPCPFGVKDDSHLDILKELNLYDHCYSKRKLSNKYENISDPKKKYFKDYYVDHREKLIQRTRNYYKLNKESIKKKRRDYYLKNKDKILDRCKQLYKNKREKSLKINLVGA